MSSFWFPFLWILLQRREDLQIMVSVSRITLVASSISSLTAAQTFQRLGGCPSKLLPRIYPAYTDFFIALGCILPPDQTDFLAGQYFDIRVEVCEKLASFFAP